MGTQYLTDTNVIIELLGGILPDSGSAWLPSIIDQNLHHFSIINVIELLGHNGLPEEMQTLKDFTEFTNIIPLSDIVVQTTIELRKSYKIKLPDAIIAVTALSHGFTIITRNTSDFEKISGLICIDAHKQ